ncbi:MAG TPA: diaminopimelate epimerase [Steroidobacteraceae bacterium]|nr:diaminopimelate epimerase [Steroidobacteraceae bacterium]
MRIDFTKMHGVGNDFIVFDAPPGGPPSTTTLRRLADRRTGIGFDQALVLEPPRRAGSSLSYRVFNADGSEVEQCGNGARCVAALWQRRGRASSSEPIVMDSAGGTVRARVLASGLVSVEMGVPSFDPRALPFDAPGNPADDAPFYELEAAGETVRIGTVSLGNPHAVLLVDSVDAAPVERLGPAIERHPRFPNRVNAGFLQIVDRAHVRVRVHERGVGETLACGTGSCAAVAFARRRGLLDSEVSVRARGGELRVDWDGAGEPIWLTGPAEFAFEGRVEIAGTRG